MRLGIDCIRVGSSLEDAITKRERIVIAITLTEQEERRIAMLERVDSLDDDETEEQSSQVKMSSQ